MTGTMGIANQTRVATTPAHSTPTIQLKTGLRPSTCAIDPPYDRQAAPLERNAEIISRATQCRYTRGMADSSFDIVSKVDHQEAENALNQARKEVEQRYDFKGTGASIAWSGEQILIVAATEERAKAVLDVFQSKLIKRGISLKSLESGEPFASGKEFRIVSTLKDGISSENAKKIGKIIRDEGPKGVKSQIQGDELRVQSKSRDDLQSVIALLKGSDLDIDLQFINYR
jgi:uncharacterized protein YajQ (UPF0234 family)